MNVSFYLSEPKRSVLSVSDSKDLLHLDAHFFYLVYAGHFPIPDKAFSFEPVYVKSHQSSLHYPSGFHALKG